MTCLGSATSLSLWLQQLSQQEQAALRAGSCAAPCTMCLVIRESDLVENKDGQQGKQTEELQQLSCTTRA